MAIADTGNQNAGVEALGIYTKAESAIDVLQSSLTSDSPIAMENPDIKLQQDTLLGYAGELAKIAAASPDADSDIYVAIADLGAVYNEIGKSQSPSNISNLIGAIRTGDGNIDNQELDKKIKNAAKAAAAFAALAAAETAIETGVIGLGTVLNSDQLTSFTQAVLVNIQDQVDADFARDFGDRTEDQQNIDLLEQSTMDRADVLTNAQTQIDTMLAELDATDLPEEQKTAVRDTLLERSDALAELQQFTEAESNNNHYAGAVDDAWNNATAEQQDIVGSRPNFTSVIDAQTGEIRLSLKDEVTGETIDGDTVTALKEQFGVENLADIPLNSIEDGLLQAQVANAQIIEATAANFKTRLENEAIALGEQNEQFNNTLREQIQSGEVNAAALNEEFPLADIETAQAANAERTRRSEFETSAGEGWDAQLAHNEDTSPSENFTRFAERAGIDVENSSAEEILAQIPNSAVLMNYAESIGGFEKLPLEQQQLFEQRHEQLNEANARAKASKEAPNSDITLDEPQAKAEIVDTRSPEEQAAAAVLNVDLSVPEAQVPQATSTDLSTVGVTDGSNKLPLDQKGANATLAAAVQGKAENVTTVAFNEVPLSVLAELAEKQVDSPANSIA